jgi:hypothetical protein
MWLLWSFIFVFPVEIRGLLYRVLVDTGFIGGNAVFLVHAVISVITMQAVFKALLGVPLGDEIEPADVDLLFPAPIQPRVLFAAKYVRSIPRRLLFLVYGLLAFSPVLAFFTIEYRVSMINIGLIVLMTLLLGEIGALATHALYCLRRLVDQRSRKPRLLHLLFYAFVAFAAFLLLVPAARVGNNVVLLPVFGLASLVVGLGTNGTLAPTPARFDVVVFCLIIVYLLVQRVAMRLSNAVGLSLYEDLSVTVRRRGVALGLLAHLPVTFRSAGSPLRALLKKDILMGLRSPAKAFYLAGIVGNLVLSFMFVLFSPVIRLLIPIPPDLTPLTPGLYLILLVLLIPLLAIGTSDPFQGEYGCIHFLRLARLPPLKVTVAKFCLLLVTPVLLAIPFAVYFAALLGDLGLLLVAVALLPHAILLSASLGTALGSRYPYITRAKSQMPVALLVAYPVLTWLATAPVAFVEVQFLQAGIWFMLLAAVIVIPYTVGLMLVLLTWAAHSYLGQE